MGTETLLSKHPDSSRLLCTDDGYLFGEQSLSLQSLKSLASDGLHPWITWRNGFSNSKRY